MTENLDGLISELEAIAYERENRDPENAPCAERRAAQEIGRLSGALCEEKKRFDRLARKVLSWATSEGGKR